MSVLSRDYTPDALRRTIPIVPNNLPVSLPVSESMARRFLIRLKLLSIHFRRILTLIVDFLVFVFRSLTFTVPNSKCINRSRNYYHRDAVIIWLWIYYKLHPHEDMLSVSVIS
jgi:hypothetical protein